MLKLLKRSLKKALSGLRGSPVKTVEEKPQDLPYNENSTAFLLKKANQKANIKYKNKARNILNYQKRQLRTALAKSSVANNRAIVLDSARILNDFYIPTPFPTTKEKEGFPSKLASSKELNKRRVKPKIFNSPSRIREENSSLKESGKLLEKVEPQKEDIKIAGAIKTFNDNNVAVAKKDEGIKEASKELDKAKTQSESNKIASNIKTFNDNVAVAKKDEGIKEGSKELDKAKTQIESNKIASNIKTSNNNVVVAKKDEGIKESSKELDKTEATKVSLVKDDYFTVRPLAHLLAQQQPLIKSIKELLPHEDIPEALIDATIRNTAAYIYTLPASECYHHEEEGGLFRHSLECAQLALQNLSREFIDLKVSPDKRIEQRRSCSLCVFIGGLLHDIGKVLADLEVFLPNLTSSWSPTAESLYSFLKRNRAESYSFSYTVGRGRRHEAFAQMLVVKILPQELISYLLRAPKLLEELYNSLNGDKDSLFYNIIKTADMRSVELELAAESLPMQAYRRRPRGMQCLIYRLQDLIRQDAYAFNNPQGFVFRIGNKCFLAFNTYKFLELVRPLRKAGIPLSFNDNIGLYEALIGLGIACYASAESGLILQSFLVLYNNQISEHYGVEITNAEFLFALALAPAPLPRLEDSVAEAFAQIKQKQKEAKAIPLAACLKDAPKAEKSPTSLGIEPVLLEKTVAPRIEVKPDCPKEELPPDNPLHLPIDSPLRARDENGRFKKLIVPEKSEDKDSSLEIKQEIEGQEASLDNCSDYLKAKLARMEAAKEAQPQKPPPLTLRRKSKELKS